LGRNKTSAKYILDCFAQIFREEIINEVFMQVQKGKEIFVSAGDFSGDMHAAFLVKNLKQLDDTVKITAIGGKFLEEQNVNFLTNIVDTQSFGFSGLLKKYYYFKNLVSKLIFPYLQNHKIDLLILIDFYGFNIHLAKLAKSMGIKVVYYICPQIWASRRGRIKNIKKYVDFVVPIFPFEKAIYEAEGIEVFYAGNPLVDIINEKLNNDPYLRIEEKQLIGLMPGSRISEVKNILPIFLKAINGMFEKYGKGGKLNNIEFCLIVSKNMNLALVENLIAEYNLPVKIKIITGPAYKLRQSMRFIMTSSGTSSFENLILNTPMMIFYKMDWFSYFIAKLIVRVKYIGMPNILAGEKIVPEYVQNINYEYLITDLYSWATIDKIINYEKKVLQKLASSLINSDTISDENIITKVASYILSFCVK